MSKHFFSYYSKQLSFNYEESELSLESFFAKGPNTIEKTLIRELEEDLDFQNQNSGYATHNFHAFPAKFPPQLPAKFILALTREGDNVLDPMMGSGTTILEAYLTGRRGIGFDIDPLAIKITKVKTTALNPKELAKWCKIVVSNARRRIEQKADELKNQLAARWDHNTKHFIDYWFARETQLELISLLLEIENIGEEQYRNFFEVAFSAAIITKSGGVSLALDLAHTRPHKAKIVISKDGTMLLGKDLDEKSKPRAKVLTKKLRSAIDDFEKRCYQNINSLLSAPAGKFSPEVQFGNAQALPLKDESMDLVVTSPPYASNAIDYMRAHKFSLIWLGYPIDGLSEKRKEYIGGESTNSIEYENLPMATSEVVQALSKRDEKRGRVLHRYYSEMKRALQEMYRVLKPGKAAIVVVGNSVIRGIDTQTQNCLAEIGQAIGFNAPKIGIRRIDRNKRMMPAGSSVDSNSQIQQRMHVEYVIGFYKPQ